jgi:hypothetical protein
MSLPVCLQVLYKELIAEGKQDDAVEVSECDTHVFHTVHVPHK